MNAQDSRSWYVPAKPTSYSVVGFIIALIGGTLLAGIADLGGQIALGHFSGLSPEAILRRTAAMVVDPASIGSDRQVLAIGAGVHFAIILLAVLIYLIAAARMPLVNSAPEISMLGYGVIMGYGAVAVPLMLRWGGQMPATLPIDMITALLRYVFLVAMPIAIIAKLAARRA